MLVREKGKGEKTQQIYLIIFLARFTDIYGLTRSN